MSYTDTEVLQFVRENDVKFIRLAFCDIYGTLKNIAIMAEELPRAFEYGVAFNAGMVRGFSSATHDDMVLHPDASTLEVLPWRPQTGRVARFYCDITYPDGTPFEQDGRQILRQALSAAQAQGISARIGAKSEFYLFRLRNAQPLTDQGLRARAPFSLVFGNEASGLPSELEDFGNGVIIAHNHKIDSLNLAVAAGIGLHAFSKANS